MLRNNILTFVRAPRSTQRLSLNSTTLRHLLTLFNFSFSIIMASSANSSVSPTNVQSEIFLSKDGTKMIAMFTRMMEDIHQRKERLAKEREGLAKERELLAKEREGLAKQKEGLDELETGLAKENERLAKETERLAKEEERIKAMDASEKKMKDATVKDLENKLERCEAELLQCRAEVNRVYGIIAKFQSLISNESTQRKRQRVGEAKSKYNEADAKRQRSEHTIAVYDTAELGPDEFKEVSVLLSDSEDDGKTMCDADIKATSVLNVDISGDGIFDQEDSDLNSTIQTHDQPKKCNWACVLLEEGGCGPNCRYQTVDHIKRYAEDEGVKERGVHMSMGEIKNTKTRGLWQQKGTTDPQFTEQF